MTYCMRRVYFENFVHAEHVQKNAAFERRADAHADAALGDDRESCARWRNFKNLGNGVVACACRTRRARSRPAAPDRRRRQAVC